ncbi:UNKNOWN [Stylonychia lemnae]|uniref:Uncharacterized protein n=1 Tax=Stylonychia lemnae TaxID=5949 RepID=A0A078ARZ9_STYLE|nr:UNKNOWN [Stylonychia lemnae]|eukprot:CDW85260.1 UNKNOWN [Stylonychia lemnae]
MQQQNLNSRLQSLSGSGQFQNQSMNYPAQFTQPNYMPNYVSGSGLVSHQGMNPGLPPRSLLPINSAAGYGLRYNQVMSRQSNHHQSNNVIPNLRQLSNQHNMPLNGQQYGMGNQQQNKSMIEDRINPLMNQNQMKQLDKINRDRQRISNEYQKLQNLSLINHVKNQQQFTPPPQPKSIDLVKIQDQVRQNQQIIGTLLKQYDDQKKEEEEEENYQMQKKLKKLQKDQAMMKQRMMNIALQNQQKAKQQQEKEEEEQRQANKPPQMMYPPFPFFPQNPNQPFNPYAAAAYQQQMAAMNPGGGQSPLGMPMFDPNNPFFNPFEEQQKQKKLEEELKKQQEDARFLNELLNQPDRLTKDPEEQDMLYEQMKEEIQQDQHKVDDLLKGLNLPKIDAKEEEKMLNNLPQEIKQKEMEEQRQKKNKELKDKYKNLIQQSEQITLRKASKRYFRAIVRTIINTLRLYRESIKNKLRLREQTVKDMDDAIKLYNDVAKGWLMKSIKKPLISILQDPNQSFDFSEKGIDDETSLNRLMKLKVRAKGIIQSIAENTDIKNMPLPLIIFINSLTKAKNFVPQDFLTEYELNRLNTDSYGAITQQLSEDQIKMVGGIYLLGKILIVKILFNPNKSGISMQFNDKMLLNFKLLSSVLYNSFLEYMDQITAKFLKPGTQDRKGSDGISQHMLQPQQVKLFYSQNNYQFRNELFLQFDIFLKKLFLLVSKADELKQKYQNT